LIVNSVTSLAGIALGGVIAYLSARHISDRNARANANAKLRAAFAPALAQLDLGRRHGSTHNCPDFDEYFEANLPSHAAAIEEFRVFVAPGKGKAYQKAWTDYYKSAKAGKLVAEFTDGNDPWSVIEGKIKIILEFTKA